MEELFFELLQVTVGAREQLSRTPTAQEWQTLYEMANKQSLTGVAFYGVQKLPQEQWPERSIVLQWVAATQTIQQRNRQTTEVCQLLVKHFQSRGFRSCILKGQAHHVYYGKELGCLRVCGDVDIWLAPEDAACKHPVSRVFTYLYEKEKVESLCYLHAELKPVRHVPVEVHLRPSFMNEPVRNHRFQKLFGHGAEKFHECVENKLIDDVVELPVLKTDYDMIFQLNHIYRHLIDEGVGLRQVLDYYMLLKSWHKEHKLNQEQMQHQIKNLGMDRFAGALMYVLQHVFAMDRQYLICAPSVKDGQFLLGEILLAGNFGHYDERMNALHVRKGNTSYQLQRAKRRFLRNLHFIKSYPSEVFWEPIARIEHLYWRKLKLWRI